MVRHENSCVALPCDACLFRFDKILNIYDTMLSSVAQQLVETIESENVQENYTGMRMMRGYLTERDKYMQCWKMSGSASSAAARKF